ncbi:ABC transporter ATP-binding protein [Roseitranquillus sediminis]|uniref:ABC transporter ATP-binding protein n=1 Tax=Roseitranquillus sediminis TaxID=2809051 RepID=UPI001D0C3F0F|nr:ABC transporter ATP-binding protein [Roseitranquillus sediminis]MBM9593165.1 ABC transporter ATP-binding protein [Roseitranquillus sediminis]
MTERHSQPAATARDEAAPEIQFRNVSKRFGTLTAVDHLNLEIGKGELVALLGKTGCGKSTMFNMIAGLMEPTEGAVTVMGRVPFREFDWFRGKMAIVFQNDRLLPWRTAVRNVELGLEMLGISAGERRARALRWLETLGLKGHENDYPYALSGGMRQRVSIARAFATDAELLLCDEPFSALDEMTSARLRTEFARLVRDTGKTAVFITHSINEAFDIGDRIVVLKRPAEIAHDIQITPDTPDHERERIRAVIHHSLSA